MFGGKLIERNNGEGSLKSINIEKGAKILATGSSSCTSS